MSWLRDRNGLVTCIKEGQGPLPSLCPVLQGRMDGNQWVPSIKPASDIGPGQHPAHSHGPPKHSGLLPAKLRGFWPKLRIPLYSHCINTQRQSLLPHSLTATADHGGREWFYKEEDWLILHYTEVQPWVWSQVFWFPDKYCPMWSLRLTSKSQGDLQGGLCIWWSCIKNRGKCISR